MPRKKKITRRTGGSIAYETKRKKYKVTYKGAYIGRYNTKAEAEDALYLYKHSPKFEPDKSTFKEVYEIWYKKHLAKQAEDKDEDEDKIEASNTFKGHRASFNAFKSLHNKQFCTLKIIEVEDAMQEKEPPMQRKMKALIRYLLKYALRNYIIDGNKFVELNDVNIDAPKNKEKHYPFSQEEIDKLWAVAENDIYIQLILMCIYCGCRFGEMVMVKKSDVHLDKNCFWIQQGKTASARRAVPIHKRTRKFFENWMSHNDSDYLITKLNGNPMNFSSGYGDFLKSYWIPKLDKIGIYHYVRENGDEAVHFPHDVRVTFTTRWTDQKLDQTLRKKIQGHSSGDVGIEVYTKPFIATLVDEVNKLD